MKIIAHSYVAEKVTDKKHPNLYVGSLLPDLVPYTAAVEIFDYASFHDGGGNKLISYLQIHAPEDVLLAIGMLAHGRAYGADYYNDVKYQGGPGWAYQKKESLIEEVVKCSQIPHEAAVGRAHNFIELGIDYLLLRKESGLIRRIKEALSSADLETIATYLSGCFQKDKGKILAGLHELFSYYQRTDLNSAEGLARIWARQATGLPEHDQVDVGKATEIIKKAADLIKNDYQEFLEFTILRVRENLKPFLLSI